MRDENSRVREKFELSLDGRQIASIVVGALVILGVVFVLGLNVGRQVASRQADAARAGDLEALDRPPSTPSPGVDDASLTFHDRLVKQKPATPPPVPAAITSAASASPPPSPSPAPAVRPSSPTLAAAAAPPAPQAATPPSPAPAKPPEEKAQVQARDAKPAPSGGGAFTIQIGATQQRPEADRIAARYRSLRPRVETADVEGKGRWYRVRVGSFETREAAERYRKDVARETGVPGYVTASR
ncbi:SPOR domain-containing protein [Anaeromyxobacter terrae]|uniref:SPOR domain-containing protein n=1 Tax=Anaeromyxobacter terrae TaxID=2925406 RepID=UPI001F565990|nr:SPOR domain-containing protein [Anaeromyxobacter sp. SG22]